MLNIERIKLHNSKFLVRYSIFKIEKIAEFLAPGSLLLAEPETSSQMPDASSQ
jgi:hypothetical protein